MSYHEWLRLAVMLLTAVFAILMLLQVWQWHREPNNFDVRDLFMSLGKDKKPHMSRPAIAELVALFATTSGYLGALAVNPDLFPEATAVYGSIWSVRGAFSTYIKNRAK